MMVEIGRGDILNAMTKKIIKVSMYVLLMDVHLGVILIDMMESIGNIAN